jgi:hypothetical protein
MQTVAPSETSLICDVQPLATLLKQKDMDFAQMKDKHDLLQDNCSKLALLHVQDRLLIKALREALVENASVSSFSHAFIYNSAREMVGTAVFLAAVLYLLTYFGYLPDEPPFI